MRPLLPAAVAALLLVTGCGGDGSARDGSTAAPSAAHPSETTEGSAPPSAAPGALPRLRLQEVARFDAPLDAVPLPDESGRVLVLEKGGRVLVLERDGRVLPTPFLDLRRQVSSGSEQGLLGLAFLPGSPGKVFVDYTDRDGDTVVAEYRWSGARADAGSARTLLAVDQPFANHNGGQLLADPDGHLLVALGDGGSGGDPRGTGQDLRDLLGSYLRIDPEGRSGGRGYGVPADNPFTGEEGARPEVWAYGLRNPWRAAFDSETGELWVADVGQDQQEELNVVPRDRQAGANYGWPVFEGQRRFSDRRLRGTEPLVRPVHVYGRKDGCSITGGRVYRGDAVPGLAGWYLFADFCAPGVRATRRTADGVSDPVDAGLDVEQVASFGLDADGELLVVSLNGPVYRVVAA